jgi:5-methylcytosine-specific restriction enzyme A
MARLKAAPLSRLKVTPVSRLVVAEGRAATEARRNAQSWRGWYKTARWQKLRLAVLVRDLWTCRRCGLVASGKGQAIADHVRPHRGDPVLFWDAGNLQCLCKPCHDGAKAREEARRR